MVDGNVTQCRACLAALPCTPICMNPRSIDRVNAKSGNCTGTPYASYACKVPPPPPTPQQLACEAVVVKACAQNTTRGHPPYARNGTKCTACYKALGTSTTPPTCPAACTVVTHTGKLNKTTCETGWMSDGCRSMLPPVPPRPPPKPIPFKPDLIGTSACVLTVGARAAPFDPSNHAVVPLPNVLPFDAATMGAVTVAKGLLPQTFGLEMIFDASTRASRRMRRNQDDFNEIWSQLQRQGKVGATTVTAPLAVATPELAVCAQGCCL